MSGGEVCKVKFSKVSQKRVTPIRLDIPPFPLKECCFKLPVFADVTAIEDEFKNDKHSVIEKYDKNLFTDVVIALEKYELGVWVEKADLLTNLYGKAYPYGTFTNSEDTLKYVAYEINWLAVMVSFGEGTYRFKFKETNADTSITESFYPFEFCLKSYLPYRADKTTRFTWYTKGLRGDYQDDEDIWDFTKVVEIVGGDGWFNQMRLPDSFFGDNKSGYEREYVRYSNGRQVWLSDEQVETYEFHSGMYPALLHDFIKTNIIQADRIFVTDYNKLNPNLFNNKAVKCDGNYEPSWNYNNLNAFVTVPFVQEFQNRRKLRC